jgi:two-component system sensor histidine kinase QseC
MSPVQAPWLFAGRSLQTRLLVTVLGLLVGVWVAVAAVTWYDTGHELNELLDAHLSQAAALLVTQRLDDLEGDNFPPPPTLHKYQTRVAIQVWHEGALAVRSTNAPDAPLADGNKPGLSSQIVDGQAWRVLTTPGHEADVVIHVGELESARRHIMISSLSSSVWPMLLALPLLALGVWWAVLGAVQPLRALGTAVAARRPESLEPLSAVAAPPEVAPLVDALNGLFQRMTELLESERRFTADAAHELRTPIAAIRMQAQVAQGASTGPERAQALAATVQGCDRATRLVEQLLQLARLEAEAAQGGPAPESGVAPSDLTAAARTLLADMAPKAHDRHQALALEAPGPVSVPMPATLTQVLLRNLIDNALRYSPDGATVQVSVLGPASGWRAGLVVEDSGPGLPPEALARLGERFYRVLGTGQSGSGLGWSIVQRLVRLHGLNVTLDRSEALGGLRVRLVWPDFGHSGAH